MVNEGTAGNIRTIMEINGKINPANDNELIRTKYNRQRWIFVKIMQHLCEKPPAILDQCFNDIKTSYKDYYATLGINYHHEPLLWYTKKPIGNDDTLGVSNSGIAVARQYLILPLEKYGYSAEDTKEYAQFCTALTAAHEYYHALGIEILVLDIRKQTGIKKFLKFKDKKVLRREKRGLLFKDRNGNIYTAIEEGLASLNDKNMIPVINKSFPRGAQIH